MTTHHSSGRPRGSANQELDAGMLVPKVPGADVRGTLPGGIHPVSIPMAACPPTAIKPRAGAMNSFPFMICYDDTPEG